MARSRGTARGIPGAVLEGTKDGGPCSRERPLTPSVAMTCERKLFGEAHWPPDDDAAVRMAGSSGHRRFTITPRTLRFSTHHAHATLVCARKTLASLPHPFAYSKQENIVSIVCCHERIPSRSTQTVLSRGLAARACRSGPAHFRG